jgi:WD40 repeat protein
MKIMASPGVAVRTPDAARSQYYYAFISYHQDADNCVASRLQAGLQRFSAPWYRRRALRVFRDTANLGATPHLWESIQRSLDASASLILLVCQDSAASPWVAQEVQYWCEHKSVDSIFLVVTEPQADLGDRAPLPNWDPIRGNFSLSGIRILPECLDGAFDDEPRLLDLRWGRADPDTLSLRNAAFQELVADIAAPLKGVARDELIGEDLRQYRRSRRFAQSAIVVLLVLTLSALSLAWIAARQSGIARQQAASAEARQYAAQSEIASDPYQSLLLAIAAQERKSPPPIEARSAFADASSRSGQWSSRLITTWPLKNLGNIDGIDSAAFNWPNGDSTLSAAFPNGAFVQGALRTASAKAVTYHFDGSEATVAALPDRRGFVQVSSAGLTLFDSSGRRGRSYPLCAAGQPWDVSVSTARYVAAYQDGTGSIVLCDLRSGRRQPILGYNKAAWAVAWSPDGQCLAVVGGDGARVWNARTGRMVTISRVRSGGELWSVAWSRDGRRFATGSDAGVLTMWDGGTGARLATRQLGGGRLSSLSWSPDGRFLMTVVSSGQIRLLDGTSGDPVAMVWRGGADESVGDLSLSPDGRFAAVAFSRSESTRYPLGSGHSREFVRVWEVSGAFLAPVAVFGSGEATTSIAWSSDGQYIAGSGEEDTLSLWAASGDPTHPRFRLRVGELFPYSFVAWNPRSGVIAVATDDGIRVVSIHGTGPTRPFWASGGTTQIAWSPDGKQLVGGTDTGGLDFWNPVTQRQSQHLSLASEPVSAVAWSGDGAMIAAATTSGAIVIASLHGKDWTSRTLQVSTAAIRALGFSRGGVLAIGADDGGLFLLNPGARAPQRIEAYDEGVNAVAWSPAGDLLGVARSGRIQFWQTTSIGLVHTIQADGWEPTGLTWSPDGSTVAVADQRGGIRLWRAMSQREACTAVVSELSLTDPGAAQLGVCKRPSTIHEFTPIPSVPVRER